MRHTLLIIALPVLLAVSVRADIIFGNLPNTGDGAQSGISNTSGKAIGFTMAGNSYDLTSVTLRLNSVGQTANDVPVVRIYTSSGTAPSVSLGTLTNPTFNPSGTANYVFTPATSITLAANTSYFLTVHQAVSASPDIGFNWLAGSPSTLPTSVAGIATSPTAVFGFNTNPTTWTSASSTYNWFQIDGTLSAVPEPGTYAAITGAAALAACGIRRRRTSVTAHQ